MEPREKKRYIPILSHRNQLLSGTVSTVKKTAPVSNVIANKQVHLR